MKPETLVLRNIGPFRGTHTVDFTGLGDIFLVYGKTGAGKTTIFDAISYALYGEAPGERKGISREMRSQYADPSDESAVSFAFALSGKRYRVTRTLPYEKIGVRSGKVQSVPEEVTLEEETEGAWKDASSTNKSDTNARVESIIGLSADEFSRIVLLPQGEFARFLRLNSNERKVVLSKLFPVEQYARVTELARDRSRELSARLKETEKELISLQERFNRQSYEGDRDALARNIEDLKSRRDSLRSTIRERSTVLERSRAAAQRKERERELAARLSALESDTGRVDGLRAQIERARRAAPLAVKLAAIEENAARAESGKAELSRLDGEISAERVLLDGLEAQKDRLSALASEKDELLLSRERLRVAVGIAESLETEIAAYETTKRTLTTAKAKKAELEGEREKLAQRLAALEAERSTYDARNEESARARDALEAARQVKALADEYGAERKTRDAHAGAIGLIAGDIELARRDGEIAKAELEAIEREAEDARVAGAAADLASRLEAGKPCPVCGSLDHPAPAQGHALAGFTGAERIDAGKRRLETLSARIAALEKTQAAREADLANSTARLGALEKKLSTVAAQAAPDARMPSPVEATESVRTLAKAAQDAQDALARARSAWREAEEITRRAAEVSAEIERGGKALLELERAAAEQKAETAQKKARFREAFPSGDGSDDPTDALERCESRILEIESDLSSHESKLTESRARAHVLSGKRDSLALSLAEMAEGLAKDEASFTRDLEKAGFAGQDEARKAAIPEGERVRLERAVSDADAALAETRGLLADVRKELSGWDGPDADSVVAELDGINAALAEADSELESRSGALAELEALKARNDELEAERAERSIAAGRMSALANDLTGANSLKTGFDAWILGMYLEEITAYANSRLERMSEGRYRIQLNDSYRKGNAYAGLDLEILDAYTGKARPSATLSGGETFMASISLALGLADSIQSRSGGIQLDAVFIDEGFGSLDESSLERAIGILDEIRGSRMVGIVSHVVELRSRIPNRIEVVKTVAGSSIRKELNTQGEI